MGYIGVLLSNYPLNFSKFESNQSCSPKVIILLQYGHFPEEVNSRGEPQFGHLFSCISVLVGFVFKPFFLTNVNL